MHCRHGRPIRVVRRTGVTTRIATRDRRARVERLFGQRTWATADVRTWLEAVIQEHTPPASVAAVCALGAMMPGLERRNATYRLADIVLTENGTLVPPDPTAVFLRGERDSSAAIVYVHEDLARHEATVEALSLLGIGKVDAVRELEALLNGGSGELDWDAFWSLTRAMSDDEAAAVVESPGPSAPPIHVRVVAGPFVPIETALLPGKVVPEDRSRDETIAIDTAFHKPDLGLLHRLGMSDGPTATGGSLAESWCRTYLAWCRKVYEDALTARHGRPQQSYIVLEQGRVPWSDFADVQAVSRGCGRLHQRVARFSGCLRRSLLIGQLYLRDRGGNDGLAPGTLEQ